jgi:hypothetical protein
MRNSARSLILHLSKESHIITKQKTKQKKNKKNNNDHHSPESLST